MNAEEAHSSAPSSGGEVSRESSQRMRRDQRHHSVAAKAKPVHPMGQPISASTNSGFKVRRSPQILDPPVGVGWARREWAAPTCSDKGRLFLTSVAWPAWIERWSRAVGVAHNRA